MFVVVVGLQCSRNNIFSPSVITGFVWAFALTSYLFLGKGLPDLSATLLIGITLWVIGVGGGSLVTQSATYRNSRLDNPSHLIRDIYLFLSVIFLPKLYFFVTAALANATSNAHWAFKIRMAATGQGSGFDEPFSGFFVLIWEVCLLLELLCYDKKKKWRLIVASLCFLAFGAATMSKIVFLNFFLFSTSILYFKGHIKMKQIVGGLCILLVLFATLQSIRSAIKFSDVNESFLVTYIVSNLCAFDTLTPCSSLHFGENTFRIFYAIAYKTGLSGIEPIDAMLKWIEKPIETNTYTTLYPFYVDFGIGGVIIFSLLTGFFYGWLFKKAQNGSNFHITIYAIVLSFIIMQYAAEQIITNLSGFFKLFVLLLIPFACTKHNFLVVKDLAENKILKAKKQG